MKIVILDGHPSNPGDLSWAELACFGELTVYPRTAPEEVLPRIADAEVVFLNKTPIGADIFPLCPKLRMIGILATGYNIVDIAAAKAHGVVVCNVPGYSTMAVAQMTFALLLEMTQQVGRHSREVFEGKWQTCPDFCYWSAPLTELEGQTMGLIGFGAIGQAVGRIALSFGMKVLVHTRTRHPLPEGCEFVSREELFRRSHVISLHCPQTEETFRMINAKTLEQMRPGTILLNTARGGLIDEAAVRAALESGKLAFYGADVVSKEPIEADNPLLQAPNCFLSPHVAWAPTRTRQRLHHIAAENLCAFLSGNPKNVVNP